MITKSGFEIKFVFLAYIPPYDAKEQPKVLETEILKTVSKTTDYLFKIFDASIDESKVEITFNSDGNQNNEIRNLVLSIAQKVKVPDKKKYAEQLAQALYVITDERNGRGLFTVIVGKKGPSTRLVLSRFKGDEGLVNRGKKLLIDYMSEVFTTKSNHYKLAVFQEIVSDKSFWKGYSVDKQLSASSMKSISLFWVEKFLNARTALTSAQGTMQFSKAIKAMLLKTTMLEEQEEIISGVVNLRSKVNMKISIADFCEKYLSQETAEKLKAEVRNDDFFNSVFDIDNEIYRKEFGKTVLSIQDGITAYVPTFQYKNHVTEVTNDDGSKNVRIEGRLTSKKINVQPKGTNKNDRKTRYSKR